MFGAKLDRFELIAELASGGMGTVFLARLGGAGGFQRLYAVKRLHEHLAKHSEFIEMFLDEARLAARIHHPNVVPILEIGTTAAGYYLVMEYVEGDTAGHLFRSAAREKKVIPPRVSVRIALDVLAGLHAAHEGTDDHGRLLDLVHRDVSPHNILVSVEGASRITDFGIARAASRLAVTRAGQLKGKIAYMAPEQARAEALDRRADVFATGICLWEMLAGRRLFKADAEGEILNRLLYEPIPSIESVNPSIARQLDRVCAKALTRDLSKRFATAAEFSDALEGAARELDCLGSHREVAACINDVLGAELAERRSELRTWRADTERRSLAPPPASTRPPSMPPPGAQVSVYVPPLFDAGSLEPHADSDWRAPGPRRKGLRMLRVALTAAVLAGSLGIATCWHGRSAAFAPPGGPPTAAVEPTLAGPTEDDPVASARPFSPPADGRDPVAPAGPAEALPSATASRAVGVASARPTVAAATSLRPIASPQPAAEAPIIAGTAGTAGAGRSVPREMLHNPYR